MKKTVVHKTAAFLLAALAAGMLAACGGKQVTAFREISIYCYGTSTETSDYEIVRTEDGVRISYYRGSWDYDDSLEMEDCLERQYDGDQSDYETILAAMNECGVAAWDGFDKSSRYAVDGDGFSMTAVIDEGQEITARGLNAYPKGYSDFMKCINDLLENGVVYGNEEESE